MFFYLHPSNNSSPLRNKRSKQKIVWDLVNHQDRAVSSIQSYTDDMRVRKEILEDDIKVLARKASFQVLGIILMSWMRRRLSVRGRGIRSWGGVWRIRVRLICILERW